MSKHTPGPWVFECVGSSDSSDSCVDVYEVNNGHTRIAEHIFEADARLIAFAPDLLEALRQFANLDRSVNSDQWTIRPEYCEKARAAIAAAEG